MKFVPVAILYSNRMKQRQKPVQAVGQNRANNKYKKAQNF
jgi:hypothetical protein